MSQNGHARMFLAVYRSLGKVRSEGDSIWTVQIWCRALLRNYHCDCRHEILKTVYLDEKSLFIQRQRTFWVIVFFRHVMLGNMIAKELACSRTSQSHACRFSVSCFVYHRLLKRTPCGFWNAHCEQAVSISHRQSLDTFPVSWGHSDVAMLLSLWTC